MDRQSHNFNRMNTSLPVGQQANFDQSLPEYPFLMDNSLPHHFDYNMNGYYPQAVVPQFWPQYGLGPAQPVFVPNMNYNQTYSFDDSWNANNSAAVFNNSLPDPRARSVSFSFGSNVNDSAIDDEIFGTSSDSNPSDTSKPRSKSHAEPIELFPSFDPSDNLNISSIPQYSNLHDEPEMSPVFVSPNKPKKFFPKNFQPSRRQSTRTESNSSEDEDCAYCKSVGGMYVVYHGHNKKHCPELVKLKPCINCGASGTDNHTISHCPYSDKILLEMKPAFKARQDDNIRMRAQMRERERRQHAGPMTNVNTEYFHTTF